MFQPQAREEKILEDIYSLEWLEQVPDVYMKPELKKFIKETLVCQICLRLIDNVLELRCQHLMCRDCYLNHTKKTKGQICPFCKKVFREDDNQLTNRVKIFTFLIKQLPVPCHLCIIERQKSQQSGKGKLEELQQHLLLHEQNDLSKQGTCQNHGFGCIQQFKDSFSKSMHEGTSCNFRWKRCQQCMKIYFITDFYIHKCEYLSFLKSCLDADFRYLIKQINFQIQQFQQQKAIYVIKQNKSNQFDLRIRSQFIMDNAFDALQSKTLNVTLHLEKSETLIENLPSLPAYEQDDNMFLFE